MHQDPRLHRTGSHTPCIISTSNLPLLIQLLHPASRLLKDPSVLLLSCAITILVAMMLVYVFNRYYREFFNLANKFCEYVVTYIL
jgi:hypothetical protein